MFARRFARAFRSRARFGRDIDLALLRAISAWVCFAVGFRFVWLFSGRRGCFHGIQLAKLPRVALAASLDVKRAPQTQNTPRTTLEQPQNFVTSGAQKQVPKSMPKTEPGLLPTLCNCVSTYLKIEQHATSSMRS